MTILCTTYVPEGVVMAADSRLTRTVIVGENEKKVYTHSDKAQKIVLLRKARVGISSCGDAILDSKTISDFLRIFEIEKVEEKDTVIEVAQKLYEYTINYRGKVKFMVAGYKDDIAYVYDVGMELTLMNGDSLGNIFYNTIWDGSGGIAIKKLMNAEPRMAPNYTLMPLSDAIDFTEFLVDSTIKYERFRDDIQSCGGDIDILVITKDDAFWYQHKIYNPKK